MKPLCIIPARGGSKRFPRKNIALLHGKPLLTYVIEAAIQSNVFEHVCVSSDDDEILKIAKESGADLLLQRPAELAADTARVPHVCASVLRACAEKGSSYPSFAVMLPTSPLCTAEDARAAFAIFAKNDANYVASMAAYDEPPQAAMSVRGNELKSFFTRDGLTKRSQDLEKLYYIDGSVLFARTEVFLREGDFCGSKTIPYFIPPERSVDIDTPLDLLWAEFLLERESAPHMKTS